MYIDGHAVLTEAASFSVLFFFLGALGHDSDLFSYPLVIKVVLNEWIC